MSTLHVDALSKQHLQHIIQQQNGFIFTFTKIDSGRFIHTFCEGQLLKKMNLDQNQIVGYELKDFLPEEKATEKSMMYERAWEGEAVSYEATVFNVSYLASLNPVIVDDQVVQVIGNCIDITDRKEKELLLETSEQHFKSLFLYNPDPVFSLDENGYFTSVNDAASEITGHSEEQMKQRTFLPYITPDYQLDALHKFQQVIRGESLTFPCAIKNERNERKELRVTAVPIVINGQITGVYGVARDITKQLQYKKDLELSEERYRILVENSPIAIAVLVENKLKYVNSSCLELFTAESEDCLMGKSILEMLHKDIQSDVTTQMRKIANTDIPSFTMECKLLRIDGKALEVEMTGLPINFEHQNAILLMVSDISQRKKAEKEVEATNRQNELILNTAGDGILSLSPFGRITFANDAVIQLLEYAQQELIGMHVSILFPESSVTYSNFLEKLEQSMKEQTIYKEREQLIKRKQGEPILTDITITPITANDEKNGTVLVIKDITQQKKLDEMIIRSDKLSVLGELAAGIAHEIRNPLTSLRGFIQLIQTVTEHRYGEYCDIMLEELDRVNNIVGEFLMLSRPQLSKMSQQNPVSLIKEVVSFLYSEATMNKVNIHEDYQIENVLIQGEGNQLKQVFINLLKNAIESMSTGGNVFISAETWKDGQLRICFQDEGCGIEEERLSTLGQPFYTTKERGTGLGLMICYKIIENHRGKISFKSTVDVGTIAEIILPVWNGQDAETVFND
ncbi:PAS domain S-box protein [Bacillus sp. Marseille-Q3570]|uniref:PAS domain-containing protein n=1 Tax=Bacillus sp. Marseille-Q3570 TaxID=2963522 RepID=UPI0021B7AE33|nr:PAS domain S-box protein [Bacillus sp. Marseille-Q3570]